MSDTLLGQKLREQLQNWDKDDAEHRKPEAQIPAATPPTAPATPATTADPAPAGRKLFTPTTNVSRKTFAAVRDCPGRSRIEIAAMLKAQGYNHSSVSSLLGQMVTQKMVTEVEGRLYVNQKEYTPLKSSLLVRKAAAAAQRKKAVPAPTPAPAPKKPKQEGIAALPTAATAPMHLSAQWDPATLLDNLSLRQARVLYTELKKFFEGSEK